MVLVLTTSLIAAHGLVEPVYPPHCWVQPPGSTLWYECDSDGAKAADCLALMETAMKALDPFVPSLAEMNAHPILSAPEQGLRALKVWDRAKNSCWSDLKDRPENKHYH
jgi:hypothetical protein